MADRYKILYQGGEAEITEKKSRFIATVRPVETEPEALTLIEEMRKKYWDARHHCYAYVIGEGGQTVKCSDDGEPSQTAGRPMLDVLLGRELRNICVVVTRYFGGTLLGTGGLVRAYSGAVTAALERSVTVEILSGRKICVDTDYNGFGKIQYLAGQMEIPILDTRYTQRVVVTLLVTEDKAQAFAAQVTEKTGGQAVLEAGEPVRCGQIDGKLVLL